MVKEECKCPPLKDEILIKLGIKRKTDQRISKLPLNEARQLIMQGLKHKKYQRAMIKNLSCKKRIALSNKISFDYRELRRLDMRIKVEKCDREFS